MASKVKAAAAAESLRAQQVLTHELAHEQASLRRGAAAEQAEARSTLQAAATKVHDWCDALERGVHGELAVFQGRADTALSRCQLLQGCVDQCCLA
jgi:hypothetical protein